MMNMRTTGLKVAAFIVSMVLITIGLFAVFGQYRGGSRNFYNAVFNDVSSLKKGDSVRIAGVQVGTVKSVKLEDDNRVDVRFGADTNVALTLGTKAAVRYLNLTGDRYLELVDGPGSADIAPPGSTIPTERTESALDLDLLLGGLKPVLQGLKPEAVNALTASLIQILQGQEGNVESILGRASAFSNSLADNSQTVQQLVDNLSTMVGTIDAEGDKFSLSVDKLEQLITGLAGDREPIGKAITALESGTASLTDLLTSARPSLKGAVDQLARTADIVQSDQATLDIALQKAPKNYRKLVRLGAYGSWINQYLCGMSVRVTDLEGRTAYFPWIVQHTGRCSEP